MIYCPICGSSGIDTGISFTKKNTASSLKENLNFQIALCQQCIIFYNSSFDQKKINYKKTNITTYFSHSENEKELNNLIKRLNILLKDIKINIFDFGCGDGSFLDKVIKNNEFQISNHLGYDLDKSNKLEINFTDDIQIVKNFFTQNSNELNVVICRHVLEHLDNTSIFFDLLPTNINFLILIEVPNGYQMLSHRNRFEDLIYEHVTYFSKISLIKLIENFNYKILDNYTVLNNENLVTLAYKGNNKILEKIISNDINFLNSSFSIINHKYKKLANYLINEKVCFWGISGRCFSILTNSSNFVKDKSMLKCQLADSDVRKVGKKIPDFKNLVKSTNEINFKKIDLIIIGTKVGYNSICEEIKRNGYSNNISIWDNLT